MQEFSVTRIRDLFLCISSNLQSFFYSSSPLDLSFISFPSFFLVDSMLDLSENGEIHNRRGPLPCHEQIRALSLRVSSAFCDLSFKEKKSLSFSFILFSENFSENLKQSSLVEPLSAGKKFTLHL